MMYSTHADKQRKVTTEMTHRIAIYACVVIVHLLLIHTLHLATGPVDATAHHLPASPDVTHAGVSVTDPAGGDLGCDAPDFVAQRVEMSMTGVTVGVIAAIASDVPPPPSFLRSECVLPRPPGPDRQAILQRFTL